MFSGKEKVCTDQPLGIDSVQMIVGHGGAELCLESFGRITLNIPEGALEEDSMENIRLRGNNPRKNFSRNTRNLCFYAFYAFFLYQFG